jgi:cation diffusion facilitator CzcD-associated flavoprotein CzcO
VTDLDVVVVGAGFSGIYAVHAFRSAGLTVRAFEAARGIGGTWYWNSYPGARCDVESKDYSYSFSPDSWYVGANIPGKPRVFTSYVGGCGPYRARCDAEAAAGYEGFALNAP